MPFGIKTLQVVNLLKKLTNSQQVDYKIRTYITIINSLITIAIAHVNSIEFKLLCEIKLHSLLDFNI